MPPKKQERVHVQNNRIKVDFKKFYVQGERKDLEEKGGGEKRPSFFFINPHKAEIEFIGGDFNSFNMDIEFTVHNQTRCRTIGGRPPGAENFPDGGLKSAIIKYRLIFKDGTELPMGYVEFDLDNGKPVDRVTKTLNQSTARQSLDDVESVGWGWHQYPRFIIMKDSGGENWRKIGEPYPSYPPEPVDDGWGDRPPN